LRNIPYSLFLIILFVSLYSCSDSGTNPGNDSQPGRRDYTWSEDTLKLNDNILTVHNIWGKTPDDIWAGGTCTSSRFTLWHWNGEKWKTDSTYRHWDVSAIHGLTTHAVWCAYRSGDVQYYNGESWEDQVKISVDRYENAWFEDICGDNYNNVYGVGGADGGENNDYRAILYKYNSGIWTEVNIPYLKQNFGQVEIDNLTNEVIIWGVEFDPNGFIERAYSFKNGILSLLCQSLRGITVNKIGDHVYILTDEFMYSTGGEDTEDTKRPNILGSNYSCIGRNENDIVQISETGLEHYNGVNKEHLCIHNREQLGMILFENDLFALTIDKLTGQNIVLHGILTNSEE
jgi:hypothetical protein